MNALWQHRGSIASSPLTQLTQCGGGTQRLQSLNLPFWHLIASGTVPSTLPFFVIWVPLGSSRPPSTTATLLLHCGDADTLADFQERAHKHTRARVKCMCSCAHSHSHAIMSAGVMDIHFRTKDFKTNTKYCQRIVNLWPNLTWLILHNYQCKCADHSIGL